MGCVCVCGGGRHRIQHHMDGEGGKGDQLSCREAFLEEVVLL